MTADGPIRQGGLDISARRREGGGVLLEVTDLEKHFPIKRGLLVDRELAIPYAEPAYYYRNEEYQRRALAAWDASGAPAFIHDLRPSATFLFPREAPLLWTYLQQHYVLDRAFGPYQILRRRGG